MNIFSGAVHNLLYYYWNLVSYALIRNPSFTQWNVICGDLSSVYLKRGKISNSTTEMTVCSVYFGRVYISLQRDGHGPNEVA